jgi:lipoyl(octanoyl) transferase
MNARPPSDAWLLLRSGPGDGAFNMALDAALLELVEKLGKPVLRFYGWTERAASFGYFQKFAEVERMTSLRPLVRRPTGGGLVPHDADWTYSVVIPPAHGWYALTAVASYQRMHEWIRASFVKLGVTAELASCCRKAGPGQCFVGHEKFDVLWHDQKIAGAAQRRTRAGLLIQGSVQPPAVKLNRTDWERAMGETGGELFGCEWSELKPDNELGERAKELAEKVYAQELHNQRR